MAMTPNEMIGFFGQQKEMFWAGAVQAAKSSDYYVVSNNITIVFTSLLMQGLIGWRCGQASPVPPFREAIYRVEEGVRLLEPLGADDCTKDVPAERAAIISFLIDVPPPAFAIEALTSERRLDAVLSDGLRGKWHESAWDVGMQKLNKTKHANLAAESYATYWRLLQSEQVEATGLVELATKLFEKRAEDRYFASGDQTEGGGPDNALTVDYRLAAIMKKIGFVGDNSHRWTWS